jgi:hypothetical protein
MSIVITKTNWYLESDHFCEIINPYVFNFTLGSSVIYLKDFINPIKKAFKILKKHKIDHIHIRIFNTKNNNCTAYYDIESLNPVYIHIDTEILLSLDNFKLVIGHEIGHYINPYKLFFKKLNQFIPYWSLRSFVKYIVFCLTFLSFIYASLWIGSTIHFSNELYYIPLLFIMFFYSFYVSTYCCDVIKMWIFHWEEYWCDSFGKRLFKNIKIELTFLYSNFQSDYYFYSISDTHPTDFNRIIALSKNKKTYSFKNNDLTKSFNNIKIKIINIYFRLLIASTSINFKKQEELI